jgi:uncharacterized OsmC-like protein/alpha/beta superfamily hydrolase
MRTKKVEFTNSEGLRLSARLELPADQQPLACAIFAHCFTCSKNLGAVRTISNALTSKGIAVLRFDFTGLGQSEGEFANSNFSTNVEDLIAAWNFMEENYEAPSILIGHSLGGAAVIHAGAQLEEVKAIVTIGAPSDPEHLSHLLEESIEEIEEKGEATVNIGGRPFKVKKQFLDDIRKKETKDILKDLRKALLVMHSPQDRIVAIENAATIYHAAFHPKSFITLDGADHLLSNKEDAFYAGEIIGSWVKRYILIPKKDQLPSGSEVVGRLDNSGYTTEIRAGRHGLIADEPESVGGNDFGPSPYQLLSASLTACTVMTLQMYARRKKWDLQSVIVHIDHKKDYVQDCEKTDDPKSRIDHFTRVLELEGELDEKQKARLLEIADKCPVHKTLHSDVVVQTRLKED